MNAEERVRGFICEQLLPSISRENLSLEDNLIEYGLDSLGIMRLLDFLEKQFKVDFHTISVTPSKVKTLNKILDLIKACERA